ncbi:MAG: hypothetical protein LBJ88_01255 [Campylobacteraceae bacterium]|jgi:hypothetical protein|nr:hypothetical protein [Campylobacteraceae bacterium]
METPEFIIIVEEIQESMIKKHILNINEKINKYSHKILNDEIWKKSIDDYKIIMKKYNINKFGFFGTDYMENDIYENIVFDYIVGKENRNGIEKEKIIIRTFLHEYLFIPFGMCSKGHKSICLIEYQNIKPKLLNDCRIDNRLILCSEKYYLSNIEDNDVRPRFT